MTNPATNPSTNPTTSSISIDPPASVTTRQFWNRMMWVGIAGLFVWAYFGSEISPVRLWTGSGEFWKFLIGDPERPGSGFFPPNLARGTVYFEQIMITVKMAIWGTLLAFLAAVPLSILAAKNTSPNIAVYQVTRRILDFLRGLNEFVLALLFVSAVGLGPFPGILALAVHTTGILGKLFSEGIETIDSGQVEAVRASGGSSLQVFTHAVWPQIIPNVISMTLYRFESNVRGASVLGIVGAGGIGFYITEAIRGFDFRAASAIILMMLVTVFVVDFASSKIRERLT
jgi:phosphonate transport system permease protein